MSDLLGFYYPTTVTFVDDQQGFLNAIKYRLPPKLPVGFYTNPLQALESIQKCYLSQSQQLSKFFHLYDEFFKLDLDSMDDPLIGSRVDDICNISSDKSRFLEQSVVIVDYMMPDIDGINFCRQLKNIPIKKILLTANTDHAMATDAFNEGVIDYFILKDSSDLSLHLIRIIEKMQKQYFCSLTEKKLHAPLEKIVPFFGDPLVVQFYEKLIRETYAVEFYLLDRWGSMLFIDYEGVQTTLVVSPKSNMDSYALIAEDQEENEISEMLSKREKLIFFPKRNDCLEPTSKWKKYLFNAVQFPNRLDMFYAIIHDQNSQPLSKGEIQAQKDLNT